MTKREAIRQTHQQNALLALGFTLSEADALRRISLTLSRWAEHECNGTIERDENRGNRPFWSNPNTGRHFVAPVADREAGALKRLKAIVDARNLRSVVHTACIHCGHEIEGMAPEWDWRDRGNNQQCPDSTHRHAGQQDTLSFYIQGDPRGAALYIIRPGDVPAGQDVNIAVY